MRCRVTRVTIRLSLTMNPESIKYLRQIDPRLDSWIGVIGEITMPVERRRDPFHALMRSIAYQQLAGAAARAIWGRVEALFDGRRPTPQALIEMKDELLRGAGLSRSKIASMRDIAQKTLDGIVPSSRSIGRMSSEKIYERLLEIRGVGPWTVEMLLIFTLRRPDVMPCTDYGVRKGLQVLLGRRSIPSPKQVAKMAERWKPHRSTAALYLWRIADSAPKTRRRRRSTS
jgi:DNA-3-methyladenine glycosylase II